MISDYVVNGENHFRIKSFKTLFSSIALDIYLIDFILMIMRIEIPNSKKAYLLSLVF